jgi:pimeloyl-ACP methyl ester carboxylesterase
VGSEAHGETRPLGAPDKSGIATIADDLAALRDHLGLSRAIVGGIPLSAAVALNFVLRYPAGTLGLVLSRPAWLDDPNVHNLAAYGEIARLIRAHGHEQGRVSFERTELYAAVRSESTDAAAPLMGRSPSLGVEYPEERLLKAEPARQISAQVAVRQLTQTEAAELLGTDQPKVSALLRGRLRGFSVERLLRLLLTLGSDVGIRVKPMRERVAEGEVVAA